MSFPNSPGGTLTLPSPTHGHKLDVPSAVRNLRRSLSRSPSKLSLRASFSADSSNSASPQSPCRRTRATPQQQSQYLLPEYSYSAPPVAEPRPSVRLSLRALKASRTATPSRPLARARASPKSPLRRALNSTPDSGNAAQQPFTFFSTARPSTGQENRRGLPSSSAPPTILNKPSRHSLHIDVSGASDNSWLKALDTRDESSVSLTPGALKRSDATMNLDQPNHGSPVAKRRSLHGISNLVAGSTPDFSIFGDQNMASQGFDIHEDAGTEYELTSVDQGAAWRDPLPSPTPSYLPKRSSSLRKSTLQQRYSDRSGPGFGRRNGERHLAQMGSLEFATPAKNRPRLSNDQFCPPSVSRDSIFNSTTGLASGSLQTNESKSSHQPHPLSKTLTTSTSGNSLTEETYQYVPAAPLEKPRAHPVNPFSRSLPINATRPTADSGDPVKGAATPYHQNRFHPGIFHSTGLLSKVNRNIDDDDKKLAPPDTPCKKHNQSWAATFPPPLGSAIKKKKKNNNRNSFNGLPSTPFGPATSEGPDAFGNQGKGLHIFKRASAARSARRGSFLFHDLEEPSLSQGEENANSNSTDVPPTPTKNNNLTPSVSTISNVSEQSLDSPSANRTIMPPTSAVRPPTSHQSNSSPISGRRTPQTPQESLLPMDSNRFSLSQASADGSFTETNMPPPVTPTTVRDFRSSTSVLVTPVNGRVTNLDVDSSLYSRFDKVEQVGKGEFSTVYRVVKNDSRYDRFDVTSTTPQGTPRSPGKGQVFAVKKSRHPFQGNRDREIKHREAQILRALSSAEHVVHYVDDWEHHLHLYIQTEYCEEGTLEKFLGNIGFGGRLDDFRIFKILQDLCLGLKEIHDAGFMHLDMKPANILVNFEGSLKIGDFGLAQPINMTGGVDTEGDREYMAPEMLESKAGPAADIFSLGLMILEAAANVVLPENGPSWVRLRSGDLSEVPSLTWTPSSEVHQDTASLHSGEFDNRRTHDAGNLFGSFKRSELQEAPEFMTNADHSSSLDSIVRWMTAKEPSDRALIPQILELEGLRWVAMRRGAPATVFEGPWGPVHAAVSVASLDEDTEMMDV